MVTLGNHSLLVDAGRGRKVELIREGSQRLCVWSQPCLGRPSGQLLTLRMLVLVDVLKRWLESRGVRVDHLVADRTAHLERSFRALEMILPEGWVVASRDRPVALADLLPGDPAEELFVFVAPASGRPELVGAPAFVPERSLYVDGSPCPSFALEDATGSPVVPSSEEDSQGAPREDELREFADLDSVHAAGLSAAVFRFHCLRTHYRRPLAFTPRSLRRSADLHASLIDRMLRLGTSRGQLQSARSRARAEEFETALGDGLNAARALSVLVDALLDGTTAAGERLELVARMNTVLRVGLDEVVLSAASSPRVTTGRDFQRVA